LNCMASGARGGIKTVAAVEELMAQYPRYDVKEPFGAGIS
jgi:hypothetical protein